MPRTSRSRTTSLVMTYAVGAIAALSLVACGEGGSSVSSTSSPTSTTAEPSTLEGFLMTLDDVGAAWRLGGSVGQADFDDANQVPCDDTAVNPTILGRLRPVIGRQFEPGDGSYRHLITTITVGDPGRLSVDLGFLIDAIRACPPSTTFMGSSITIEQLEIPDLGDQRAAFRIEAATSEPVWVVRTAVVRVDRRYLSVNLTEILESAGSEPVISDAEFVAIVEKAVRRLES